MTPDMAKWLQDMKDQIDRQHSGAAFRESERRRYENEGYRYHDYTAGRFTYEPRPRQCKGLEALLKETEPKSFFEHMKVCKQCKDEPLKLCIDGASMLKNCRKALVA